VGFADGKTESYSMILYSMCWVYTGWFCEWDGVNMWVCVWMGGGEWGEGGYRLLHQCLYFLVHW